MRSTKIIKMCSSSLCTCLHHMVILRTRNKITGFLMILAWASPFNYLAKIYQPYQTMWNININVNNSTLLLTVIWLCQSHISHSSPHTTKSMPITHESFITTHYKIIKNNNQTLATWKIASSKHSSRFLSLFHLSYRSQNAMINGMTTQVPQVTSGVVTLARPPILKDLDLESWNVKVLPHNADTYLFKQKYQLHRCIEDIMLQCIWCICT